MFRRARLSVRPNVRPGGRGSAVGPEPQGSPGPGAAAAASDERGGGAAAEPPPAAPGAERDEKPDSSNDAGEASKAAEMPTQRRKRISTLPNLAKPRAGPSSAQRSSSKPQRRVVSQALDGSASLQKDSSPSEKTNVESSPKSPILPEKKTPVPQVPQFSPLKKSAIKEPNVGVAAQKNDDTLQKNVSSPLKERPTQERSVSQEEKLPTKHTSVKGKRMCSDRERILKARKLREMLKEELKKERLKQLKHRPPVIEGHSPPDRSKMTMRDLIYYLPENNPMKSSLAEEKRTEKNTVLGQMKEQEEKNTPDHGEEDEEEEAENGEESQDGPLLVPRVKVAEDGSIILDEESLTVEVLRTKGPCVVEENDPIFERGSTTTYSSFRKSFYTKPWSNKETDMFFLAISMVGTDFSLIGQLFPHRARAEIKNKFKREEKANGWRIDKAFKEKRPFDFEFFAQLLEKVLADEEKRKQKTVKSQKPKEKRPSRTRKKPKEKAASSEAASDQDNSQKARNSDVETEADAVMAEKENEGSLGVSEQTEEQATLEPASAKKKRKRRKKDDPEQEVENLPEEMSAKTAVESKSSKKTGESSVCDTNGHGPTTLGEELDDVTEEKHDQTPVIEEERSESCLPVDDITKSDLNLYSFQDGNDSVLETESTKLRMLDTGDEAPQENQLSKFPLSKITNKERQSEETVEAKNKDVCDSCKPDEKESASDGDFQPEIIETEKPALKGRFQRPKPNLAKSSGRREAATQEKLEAKNSSPKLVNEVEKCTLEDSGSNRNEITEVENIGLGAKSEEPEKTVIAKTVVRGCRQRFKPNITRVSGKKEEPGKDSEKDKMSHPEPQGETEKITDQTNVCDTPSGESAGKHDKPLETMFQCNETAGLQEGSKQTVLKPALLKRGRMPRPKPNIGRITARHEVQTQKKDPEEEKTECGEVEKGVTHPRSERNDSCLKDDVVDSEDTQPCTVMLEEDVSAEKMDTIRASQCSPKKTSEAESSECEKESSAVLNDASDFNTEKSDPQKQEEKTTVSSARLLRSRCQRPKPNLGKITARKDMPDVTKGVSQTDTHQEESLMQRDDEHSTLPDVDKTEKYEVLQSLESLGKENPLGSQEASGRPSYQSLEILLRSEDGELKSCPPIDNEKEISATDARLVSKNTTQEERKPLQPAQLVRGRFQRHQPNLRRAVGRKELQTERNEQDKKSQAEQLILQKDELANAVSVGENEVIVPEADVLNAEEQVQQEEPQVSHSSDNALCKQSSAEKSISPEDKLIAPKPAQLLRNRFQRARPNLGRANSKKESPVAQKPAVPVEEAKKGKSLPVVEESKESLSSKDDMEVLLSVRNLAKTNSSETNIRSKNSEIFSSEKSLLVSQKREQEECPSREAVESIQDTPERSGEKSKSSDIKPLHHVRDPVWKPRSNLMIVTRKRDHSEEGRSRNEDDTEIRNAGERLMSEKTDVSKQSSSPLAEAASCSQASRKHHFTDSEETSCKRIRQEKKFQSPEISSESESQEDDSQPPASQEEVSRRQSRRSSKRIASKRIMEPRTASSSASECEPDRSEKGNQRQKVKLNTKGKSLKCAHRKKSDKEHRNSKTTLVTLRASQEEEEEEDEAGDFEPDDEGQCFAPEEVNKAPVFVPVGLRSPKPVPVQIEETMEELEISANIPDVQVVTDVESLSHVFVQPVIQREENGNTSPAEANIPENPEEDKGTNDGSTEAAMTLLAMGDPTFQLKINIEEGTQMLPAQEDLHVADNLVNCVYSEQSVVCYQHLLSSPASNMDLFPSEDGSNINLEHQSTDTRTGGEECFEKNATDTSNSSVPVVSSIRPTSNRLLMPESDFRVLRSSENIIQNPVNTNVLVEELEQVQDEVTVLRGTAEMQKVELEQVRLVAGDSLDLHDFSAESTQVVKQADITERAEKETRNTCATSGELQALTASLKPEASEMGQELYPSQSSADGLPEHNPTTAERSLYTINLTQNEGGIQDFQQQYTSSTEETSEVTVVNDNHSRCAEEEQTFILTLVEIPAESKEYDDASALLEQTSEPLLPAPILISPVSASGTSVTGVESIGSLRTAVDELAASLDSKMETKQLQSSPGEPIPKLVQTAQKRSAAELEEDDFPPAKKTLSTSTEDDLESTSKDYSTKSTNSPRRAAGNLLEKAGTSVKTDVLTSAFVAVSESLPVGRSQSETLQNSGAASPGNSISRQEEEVVSRLNSERKAEISEPSKPVDVHEYAQLEHSGSIAASSKPPLLRGGRKPLGFLSLICKKSSSESAEDTKGNKGKVQKPRIVTPKRGLKNPTVSGEAGRESCSLPSASTSSCVESENMAADAAVEIPVNKQPEKPSLQANDQEKEEAPTRISEYFFSDIFMEVDDSE